MGAAHLGTVLRCALRLGDGPREVHGPQSGEKVGDTMRVAIGLGKALQYVRDSMCAQLRAIDND